MTGQNNNKLMINENPGFLEQFKNICFESGSKPALQIKEGAVYRVFSYAGLWQASQAVAAFLLESGLGQEDCVGLLFDNRPEWAICFFGIISAQCSVVPLEIKLKEKELAYILNDCAAKVIIVDKENLARVQVLKKLASNLEMIICLDAITQVEDNTVDFSRIVENDHSFKAGIIPDEHTGLIVYTSGTTGYQKGVQLTLANLLFQLNAFKDVLTPLTEDRFLSILPLSHIFEITCGLLGPLFSGCSVIYLRSLKSKDIVTAIKECRITMMIVVPLVLRMLHNGIIKEVEKKPFLLQVFFKTSLSVFRLFCRIGSYAGRILFRKVRSQLGSSLKCFICGGAPLDPLIASDFELFGVPVLEGYGLTETSPVISVNTLKNKKIGSVGRLLRHVEVRIVKDDEKNKEGEIITRGPHIMKGYLHDEEKTKEIIKDGWFYTGDIGYFDKGGYLYISGRSKNVIVTGKGKKVFPEELETEILRSPYIKDICVFGAVARNGLRRGTEEVQAIVVPDLEYFLRHAKKTSSKDIEALIKKEINETSKHLAEYKRISDFKIWYEDLPKTATKKTRRKEINSIINRIKNA